MNDLIQIIKILDEEDLKTVNDYVDTLSFSESRVFGTQGTSKPNTEIRSSIGAVCEDIHPVTKLLHKRTNEGLEKYHKKVSSIHSSFNHYPVPCGVDTTCYREGIQVLEYKDGQEYKFHHDAATDPSLPEYERKLSIITYLNDGFDGGGTEFLDKVYKPQAGYALMFPSNWCYPHSGQPVPNGKKRVAVTWYYVQNVHATKPVASGIIPTLSDQEKKAAVAAFKSGGFGDLLGGM